jgi:GTPase SAR1 family protein/uncharacterized protein YecA (UPF0149 family)
VDFAFLSDDENFMAKIPEAYFPCKSTKFSSYSMIKSFVESCIGYKAVSIIYADKNEKNRIEKHELNNKKVLFLTVPFLSEEDKAIFLEESKKELETKSSQGNSISLKRAKERTIKTEGSFRQIDLASANVKRTLNLLRQTFEELEKNDSPWFKDELREDFQDLIQKLEKARSNLRHPCLKIAFVGTTSSGKSTLLNGLIGHRIAPMEAGEMSAGVLCIRNARDMSLTVHETENMSWRAGNYPVKNDEDIYNALRDQNKGIMNLYRQASKENANVKAPEIVITAQLAPKNGGIPGFVMPEDLGLEFYDLPGLKTVTDSRNLGVIQRHLAGSFLLIVLNYSATDSEKRNKLLDEIEYAVDSICRNKDALLFVLNRVDERNSDDDPLETRVMSLQEDIKVYLKLAELPVIISMSALPLYLLQTAWGAGSVPIYEQGLKDKVCTQIEKFFDDCSKIVRTISKENPEKKAWFNEHNEDNIDDWISHDIGRLLQWVYEYSGADKFWEAMQKKLDEQIGAIIINPALEGTPSLLEEFASKLDRVVHVLGLSTKEEIQNEKEKVESLSKDIKKRIKAFKEEFIKDFKGSIEACKTRELENIINIKHKQFMEMRDILRQITIDLHDTIMVPIRDALIESDADAGKLDKLERILSESIPPNLASDIRRMTTHLLTRDYGRYAEKGHTLQCRIEEKDSKAEEIQRLQEIDKRRRDLAGYVDRALLSRSKLLLQKKLNYFQNVTQDIIQEAMISLTEHFLDQVSGINTKSMFVPKAVTSKNINLPDDVFSKITIEQADKLMKTTVWEKY